MSMVQRLWLVRHAPVAGSAGVIHGEDAPARLTDAAALDGLRRRLPGGLLVASPARRTLETARALRDGDIAVDAAFREQDFGAWTGRTHAEIAAGEPALHAAFWTAPATARPPGGESFADQIVRVRAGLDRYRESDDLVLVVHSGTIRAVLAVALDLACERALRFVVDPLSLTRLDRIGDAWRVVAVNLGHPA